MAFDPNLYALQIELSIDAGEAFSTISDLEQAVVGVEQQLSNAMATAMADVSGLATDIATELNAANVAMGDLGQQMDNQVDQFSETLSRQQEQNEETESRNELEQEYQDMLEERNEMYELYETISERLMALLLSNNTASRENNVILDEIRRTMLEMGYSMEEVNQLIDQSGVSTEKWDGNLRSVTRAVNEITNALTGTINKLAQATQGTEAFVTANFRAYGSVNELLVGSRQLAAEYGLFQEQAVEAYQALMGINVPAEMLDEYAGMVGMVNRISGAGIRTIAEYTRSVRQAGLSFDETQAALGTLTAAQEEFALSAQTVNQILEMQIERLGLLSSLYGDQVPEKMNGALAAFANIVQDSGTAEKALSDFNKIMQASGAEAMNFSAVYGDEFATDFDARMDMIMDKTVAFAEQMESMRNADGMLPPDAELQLEANAAIFGITIDMIAGVEQQMKAARAAGEEFNPVLSEQARQLSEANDLNRQMAESTDSLYKAMNQLYTSVSAVIAPFVVFIADGLTPVIDGLTFLVNQIVSVMQTLQEWYMTLEEAIPGLSMVRQGIQTIISVLIVGGITLVAFIGTLGTLGTALTSITGFLTGASAATGAFTGTVTTGLTSIGAGITGFLTTITTALSRASAALAQAALPALALGAAFLMVAGAAWVFVQAVVQLADAGPEAIDALAGLTIAVLALGAGLTFLGMLAQGPVALGIIVVAGAIAVVGLAAAAAAIGIAMAAEGLVSLIEAVDFQVAAQMSAFAVGVAALGAAGIVAAPGITVLAGAFWLLGGRANKVGDGLLKISEAMVAITDINFAAARSDITEFANVLTNSADEIVDGLQALSEASENVDEIERLIGVIGMLNELEIPKFGEELLALAESVLLAGEMMGEGSEELLMAALELEAASVSLMIASGSMIGSGILMSFATSFLFASSVNLGAAAANFNAFAESAERVNALDFGELRQTVFSLASSVNDLVVLADDLEDAIETLEDVSLDDFQIVEQLEQAAEDLNDAIETFSVPVENIEDIANSLQDQIDALVTPIEEFAEQVAELNAEIDELIEAEARLRDVGIDVAAELNPGDAPQENRPNEFRNAPPMQDLMNMVVENNSDNEEMVGLLKQILEELQKDKGQRQGFFGGVAKAPNEQEKLNDAGVNV